MIRLLHLADLHLGLETHGHPDPATGLSTRLVDFLAALDQVVEYALAQDVHLCLFCGDAYKGRDPSQTQQREFARRVQRLAAGGVAVFLVAGNHDLPHAFGRATAVEIFQTLTIPGVTVANKPGVHRLETRGGALQIIALPWARRSHYLTRDESKGLTPQEIDRRMESVLTKWFEEERDRLDPALPSVLAAHLWVNTARAGSEGAIMEGQGPVFLQSVLARPPLDYGALGHIHRQQVLSLAPPLVYAGSLQALDFSDEGQEKGFYVVELDASRPPGLRAASLEFHRLETRPFLTIEVDATASPDPTQTALEAISRHPVSGAIVRLKVKVTAPQRRSLREVELRRALQEAHHVAAMAVEVTGQKRGRLPLLPGLAPTEALRRYLEAKRPPLQPEELARLMEYGERLIADTLTTPNP
ncbi:MAG: exonuclease SbcCD subunit D [Chloroflexi bacterium]|nr:exonuclease SbcCD subunit D [Chloroflexota bacterium]